MPDEFIKASAGETHAHEVDCIGKARRMNLASHTPAYTARRVQYANNGSTDKELATQWECSFQVPFLLLS